MHVQMTEVYLLGSTRSRIGSAVLGFKFGVDRLVHGNLGKYRALKNGIFELKIDFGPGYRVYYIERDGALIILLAGGD